MRRVLVLGAGKIGSFIACLLADSGAYEVNLADRQTEGAKRLVDEVRLPHLKVSHLDCQDPSALQAFLTAYPPDAVVSSLPFYCNTIVADVVRASDLSYFDLTEDVHVTEHVKWISTDAGKAFVPQCGLAPGFVSIVASDMMTHFDTVETVKMRVGALPVHPNNALKYSLTWSTDGLINEYGSACYGLEHWKKINLHPLEGYETIEIDGLLYEAFNTSGGLGTLADTYDGKVHTMNYKTLRYPGHCEKIMFLMKDLKLNEDRETLKRILEQAIPKTLQDVVLIYVAVTGQREGDLYEETYVKKVYPQVIAGRPWSAIQVTTGAGLCSVLDLVLDDPSAYQGFVTQEMFPLSRVLTNQFGRYYAHA